MATLANKTILIFGGSSGIGYSVAEASLMSSASHIIIVSSSSNAVRVGDAVKRLENFASTLSSGVGKVQGEAVDVTDRTALKEFVLRMGEVDHIVWTSGDSLKLGFPNLDVESLLGAFDVRFWAPIVIAQNAKIRQGGSLTLTIGSALVKPQKGWSIASGIVGAVDSLTRGLAVDLAPIRVNVISPGFLWKDVSEATKKQMFADAAEKLLVKHVAEPAEIAEAYLFAMKCAYITGQRIEVDGGYVLGA
ncbi:short-chain dehydrogenase/reductase SDR [Ramaria rubella]|nr:short-chain dehydrogenase/reductase SDR [Ramaria rubella]